MVYMEIGYQRVKRMYCMSSPVSHNRENVRICRIIALPLLYCMDYACVDCNGLIHEISIELPDDGKM